MDFVKLVVFLATVVQISSGKLTRIYGNSTFLDSSRNTVKFSWTYEPSQDVLFMALEVKATGWIGFGFARRIFQMEGYDVIIGKVENGKGTLTDRHTVGYMEPLGDYQQDYNMTYYEEVNGTTRLEFHRKRLTGDSKDLDIKLGPMLLVYAYHSTRDYPFPYKTQHDHQGYKTVVLLPLGTKIPKNITSLVVQLQTFSTTPEVIRSVQINLISSFVAMSTSKLPMPLPLTSSISTTESSKILISTTSESPTTSLVMLPTIMPSSSMMSSTVSPSVSSLQSTSSLSSSLMPSITSTSSPSFSSVNVPIFVDPLDVYDKYVKVSFRGKVTSVKYEDIEDKKNPEYLKFKKELEAHLEQNEKIWKAIITDIRKGSVIVDYDIYINATSLQETRQVIDDIQKEVKQGRMGSYLVDPEYPMNPVIAMKISSDKEACPSAKQTDPPANNLILIVILSCAVGLVFIMLIIIIVLVVKLRKRSSKSSSYSIKPVHYYEYQVK